MKAAIVIVSDRAASGLRPDATAPLLAEELGKTGITVGKTVVVPDEREKISAILKSFCEEGFNLILTSGGTGCSPRDVTPEATRDVGEKEVPGIAEAMRSESLRITAHAMLSRAVAVIRGTSLIVNLPGSPKGAVENYRIIAPALPHALGLIAGKRMDP